MTDYPKLDAIKQARTQLSGLVVETPVLHWQAPEITEAVLPDTEVFLKLELFQHTGTFKARGALLNALAMTEDEKKRGVTAVSAGNHAIATAYAAKAVGTNAKVVMLSTASPIRVEKCENYGAEVVMTDSIHGCFDLVEKIKEDEGRTFIHPFNGENVALGTGCVGLEWLEQVPDLDAVIVPIGGGGLMAGISCAVKQINPNIKVYGVEPEGAQSMTKSFKAGSPQKIDAVTTICDSLGAPMAVEYSYNICRQFVDEIVLVNDNQVRDGMAKLFNGAKLAVEPAGAAATAALCGPLREKLAGKRVGVLVCGANITPDDFIKHLN
jgi:threonine dehydratase